MFTGSAQDDRWVGHTHDSTRCIRHRRSMPKGVDWPLCGCFVQVGQSQPEGDKIRVGSASVQGQQIDTMPRKRESAKAEGRSESGRDSDTRGGASSLDDGVLPMSKDAHSRRDVTPFLQTVVINVPPTLSRILVHPTILSQTARTILN